MDDLSLEMMRLSLKAGPTRTELPRTGPKYQPARKPHKKQKRERSSGTHGYPRTDAGREPHKQLTSDFTFKLPEWSTRYQQLVSCVRVTEVFITDKQFHARPDHRQPRKTTRSFYSTDEHSPPKRTRLAFAPFRLLDLPLEMRQIIYSFALAQPTDSKQHLSLDRHSKGVPRISRLTYTAFSLLSTNHQLRNEALPILYQTTHFYARALKKLPCILALPAASTHLHHLHLSFHGLGNKSKVRFFNRITAVSTLTAVQTLALTLDAATVKYLQDALFMWCLPDLCPHHSIGPLEPTADILATLFSMGMKQTEVRRIRLVFRPSGGSLSDAEREKVANKRLRDACGDDCVPCGLLRGVSMIRELEREDHDAMDREWDEAEEADGLDGFVSTAVAAPAATTTPGLLHLIPYTANYGASTGLTPTATPKPPKQARDKSVPVDVVLLRKHAGDEPQITRNARKAGLWPTLAPEPKACTDWKACLGLGRTHKQKVVE